MSHRPPFVKADVTRTACAVHGSPGRPRISHPPTASRIRGFPDAPYAVRVRAAGRPAVTWPRTWFHRCPPAADPASIGLPPQHGHAPPTAGPGSFARRTRGASVSHRVLVLPVLGLLLTLALAACGSTAHQDSDDRGSGAAGGAADGGTSGDCPDKHAVTVRDDEFGGTARLRRHSAPRFGSPHPRGGRGRPAPRLTAHQPYVPRTDPTRGSVSAQQSGCSRTRPDPW